MHPHLCLLDKLINHAFNKNLPTLNLAKILFIDQTNFIYKKRGLGDEFAIVVANIFDHSLRKNTDAAATDDQLGNHI